jgi:hypothetical protein
MHTRTMKKLTIAGVIVAIGLAMVVTAAEANKTKPHLLYNENRKSSQTSQFAKYVGTLTIDGDGCVTGTSASDERTLLVWPREFVLILKKGTYSLTYRSATKQRMTVAKIGGRVQLAGGFLEPGAKVPPGCSSRDDSLDVFIVGGVA